MKPTNADQPIDDRIIKHVGDLLELEDLAQREVNDERVAEVKATFDEVKDLFGKGVKVTLRLHEPYKSMGCITFVGKELIPLDIARFVSMCKGVSNIECYPRTDGTVQLNMTYHGLTHM